jgi:alginate export protein
LSRVYMHADLHGSYGTRVFLEGRKAEAPGRDLPGGQRTSDRDDLDWGNLFGEIARGFDRGRAVLRYGRQELLFGRERMISPSDWSNVRRSFNGTVLEVQQPQMTITGMYVHPMVVLQTEKNHQDNLTTLLGAYASFRRVSPSVFELYVLDKRVDETATAPKTSRTTIGLRIVEPFFTNWTAELEGGTQTGSAGNATINASMISSDFTRAFKAPWSPSLTLGVDRSSGTGAGKPAQSGTWDVFYALAHSYLGYADVLGRRNVTELRLVAQAAPAKKFSIRASGHMFRRTSGDDAMYDTGGNVARASIPGASMDIGNEFDFTAQWRLQRHLRLDGGGAMFTPGQFMKDTGAAQQYTWMFASLALTF